MLPPPARLDFVQALRGIAALAVVVTHARHAFRDTALWDTANHLLLPFASGVDLFFVISGFIMVYATRNDAGGMRSVLQFWLRRAGRLWPAYVVVTAAYACYYIGPPTVWSPNDWSRVGRSLAFIPAKLDGIFSGQIVPAGWTLNYEAYFYLTFGLLLLLPSGLARWTAALGWFVITLLDIPLAAHVSSVADPQLAFKANPLPGYTRVITNPIVWEFVFGMIAGGLYLSPIKLGRTTAIVVGFAACAFTIWNTVTAYDYITLRMGAGYAVLVASLAICSKTATGFHAPRALVILGSASYTLYLVHQMVIDITKLGLGYLGIDGSGWADFFTPIVVSLCIAILLSNLLERRLAALIIAAWISLSTRASRRPA